MSRGHPILARVLCRPLFQPLFERVQNCCLRAMNVGGGALVNTSGERQLIKWVSRALQGIPEPIVFDVGANVGDYTQALLEVFGAKVQLHCFEPSPSTYAELCRRVPSSANVHLHSFGLGSHDGAGKLYADAPLAGTASLARSKRVYYGPSSIVEDVELRTLDSFCQQSAIDRIDFLKIDVEGFELDVLHGARRLLEAGSICLIQFEFGTWNLVSRTYLQDFYEILGRTYTLHRILKSGLRRLPSYSPRLELFDTTNFLAIPREHPGLIGRG